MTDYYKVLGLSEDAPEQELKAKYDELYARYSEARFLHGDEGNEAAAKLMELENAWVAINADIQRKKSSEQFGGDYGEVDALIKDGKFTEAQAIMDSVKVRTAEWHYYQSIIYYRRDWLSESRAQLAMAVKMDPTNTKYTDALNRMDNIMANPTADQQSFNSYGAGEYGRQQSTTDSLCRCCATYLCIDCMCHICCR